MAEWHKRLEPFGAIYARMEREIDELLMASTAEELGAIEAAAKMTTLTNCWWAVAKVAPLVRNRAPFVRSLYKINPKEAPHA
jgi:hypothetical protein